MAYAAASAGQCDFAVQHTASRGVAVDQGQYGVRRHRVILQLNIACERMPVQVQGNDLIAQVQCACKREVSNQLDEGLARSQSFVQFGLGGYMDDPSGPIYLIFLFGIADRRNRLAGVVRVVIPACERTTCFGNVCGQGRALTIGVAGDVAAVNGTAV